MLFRYRFVFDFVMLWFGVCFVVVDLCYVFILLVCWVLIDCWSWYGCCFVYMLLGLLVITVCGFDLSLGYLSLFDYFDSLWGCSTWLIVLLNVGCCLILMFACLIHSLLFGVLFSWLVWCVCGICGVTFVGFVLVSCLYWYCVILCWVFVWFQILCCVWCLGVCLLLIVVVTVGCFGLRIWVDGVLLVGIDRCFWCWTYVCVGGFCM